MADEDEKVSNDVALLSEVQTRSAEVIKLLSKREKTQALVLSLSNPPLATKSIEIKVKIISVVLLI